MDIASWCTRTQTLMDERRGYERVWHDIVRYVMPMGPRFNAYGASALSAFDNILTQSRAAERSPDLYDSTSVWAIDRLATGIEGLITPRASLWHGLATDDPLAPPATDEDKIWLDLYRDHLFSVRYDVRSGFITSNQKAIKSACALGTGVFMTEEKFGLDKTNDRKVPITYRYIPLSECFITVDYRGIPNGLHRVYSMTAEQAVGFFGDKTPVKVREAFNNPKDRNRKFVFVHAVEMAYGNDRHNGMDFVSCHYCFETKEFIHKGGYHEFPYTVYYWHQDEVGAYGESPVMMAISEIRSLNNLSKHTNRAIQQWTDPPMAAMEDSIVNQPNMNPGKVNYGYLDPDTRDVLLKPLITAQNPSFAEAIMQAKRDQLKEALYVTLWQILLQNREMTATEALIRANEKGELIGPVGDSLQIGVSQMFMREHQILFRRGAFDPGSPLAPPQTMRGKSFGPKFISQYDRMRRSPELLGIERVVNMSKLLYDIDNTVVKRLDTDYILRATQEIGGAPARVLRPLAEAQADIEQMNQMQNAQAGAAIAEQGGKAANEIIPAIQGAQQFPPELVEALQGATAQ